MKNSFAGRFSFGTLFLAVLSLPMCIPKTAVAQTSTTAHGIRTERDIQYVSAGDPAQTLDLYVPEQANGKPRPLIVFIHGGGWSGGSKRDYEGFALGVVRQGYAAASVEYRFSQKAKFPAQIQDCQAAIRWLRANSKKFNIDPKRFGALGASAGGHLVALVGTSGGKHAFATVGGNEKQSDRVQAVCDFFGPTDFNTVMSQAAADKTKNIFNFNHPGDPYSDLIGAHMGEDKAKCEAVSPVHYVSKDNPPFLILHGNVDALVPYAQSIELRDLLLKHKVDVLLQTIPNAGHGGGGFDNPAVVKLILTFFDKQLKQMDVRVEVIPESLFTSK